MDCTNKTESTERKYIGAFLNHEHQCLSKCMLENGTGCLYLPAGGQCYRYTEDVLQGSGESEDYMCWTKPGNCNKGLL